MFDLHAILISLVVLPSNVRVFWQQRKEMWCVCIISNWLTSETVRACQNIGTPIYSAFCVCEMMHKHCIRMICKHSTMIQNDKILCKRFADSLWYLLTALCFKSEIVSFGQKQCVNSGWYWHQSNKNRWQMHCVQYIRPQ